MLTPRLIARLRASLSNASSVTEPASRRPHKVWTASHAPFTSVLDINLKSDDATLSTENWAGINDSPVPSHLSRAAFPC